MVELLREEREVAEVNVSEVVPFKIDECQSRNVGHGERGQVVVGSKDVVQGLAVVDGHLSHMVVVAGEGHERRQFLNVKFLNAIALNVEVLQL